MFRERYPIGWAFHRRTSRWPFNMHTLNAQTGEAAPFKESPGADTIALPTPTLPSLRSGAAIAARTSCCRFDAEPIPLDQLGDLLECAYGVLGTVASYRAASPSSSHRAHARGRNWYPPCTER